MIISGNQVKQAIEYIRDLNSKINKSVESKDNDMAKARMSERSGFETALEMFGIDYDEAYND
jgi:hypothetical protein